jgi:hypothetical protein
MGMRQDDKECVCYWIWIPLIVAIVILPIAGVQYKSTHDDEMTQVEMQEYIMNRIVHPFKCPSIQKTPQEYVGNKICVNVLANIDSYNISDSIQCGTGPGCVPAYNASCIFTYQVYTNDNTGIGSGIVRTSPAQFYGITSLTGCNEISPISVNGNLLSYQCTYTGTPHNLRDNYLYTVYIYIKFTTDIACETTCARNFTNQKATVTVGECGSVSYKTGFSIDNKEFLTGKSSSICGYNQINCGFNLLQKAEKSLRKAYYDTNEGTYDFEPRTFGYRSVMAMFVCGSIFVIFSLVLTIIFWCGGGCEPSQRGY